MLATFWRREPVLFVASAIAIVDACLGLAVAFGLPLTQPEMIGIGAVELAVGTFIQRGQVSPAAPTAVPDSGIKPAPPA